MNRIERMDSWQNNRETVGRADGDKPASVEQPRQPMIGSPRGGPGAHPETPDRASGRSSDVGVEE